MGIFSYLLHLIAFVEGIEKTITDDKTNDNDDKEEKDSE